MNNFKELIKQWEDSILTEEDSLVIIGGAGSTNVANNCECNSNNCNCEGAANNCNCSKSSTTGNNCSCGYRPKPPKEPGDPLPPVEDKEN